MELITTIEQMEPNTTEHTINNDTINNDTINIYRNKFTPEIMTEIYNFSKIHEYDDRKHFKEAWTLWIEENNDLINCELRRLHVLGYNGNFHDKMFKSARYYFRKKSTEKKEPVKRHNYIGSQKELLDAMDEYIKIMLHIKPSDSFDNFCKEHVDILQQEVYILCKFGYSDTNEVKNKIKKTYKNRYFLQKYNSKCKIK